MFEIGVDASFTMLHDEEYSLGLLVKFEEVGFDVIWLGDHYYPWHHSFKHNFYVWSLLPVLLSRTRVVKAGVDVTVPIGGRYHPAIIAQASATIDVMFPGRFLLGVGSGEAINEKHFLGYWPSWEERMERLVEAVSLIKKLWKSEDYFSFEGKYFKMPLAFLYLKPKTSIPIYFSAMGRRSAYVAGRHADRLMTVASVERYKEVILPSFEKGARDAGRNPDEIEKAVVIAGGIGEEKDIVRCIKTYCAGPMIREMFNEPDPRVIFERGSKLPDEEIIKNTYISKNGDELIEVFSAFKKENVNQVIWTDFSVDIDRMLRVFKEKIIPYFKEEQR